MSELDPDWAEEEIGASDEEAVPSRARDLVPIVGLGGSAGSIPALTTFFKHMPPDSGMAFVVVIHLAPDHDSHLAELLQRTTEMPVLRISKAARVEPNHVYVIPPGRALRMGEDQVTLERELHDRGRHVVVDLFLRTLGEVYGERATAIVLSGLDSDGAIGLKRVKERGGLAIAQDPDEAEHGGMPRSAIATGVVDWVLPVGEMPQRILDYRRREATLKLPAIDAPQRQADLSHDEHEAALRDVLMFLRTRTGHDFSAYKRATVVRRIARRMQVNGVDDLRGYLQCLRTLPGEAGALLQDLLISVTNFFRDGDCFKALEETIPRLLHGRNGHDRVRVWVPACATGEEAYSIAMMLQEHAAVLESPPTIQVFATDLDDQAIHAARAALYPSTIEADVSPERLRRFFIKEHRGCRVRRELRETVLFAVHDVLRDSPFSRLDLISCRNLLIYLTRERQAQLLETFHFALRGEGILFLGSSETVDDSSPLFRALDKRHRVYRRQPSDRARIPVPAGPGPLSRWANAVLQPTMTPMVVGAAYEAANASKDAPLAGTAATRAAHVREASAASWSELHFRLLEELAPPSVIINADYQVVHLSPNAGRFMQLSGGEPTGDVLRLVQPSLRLELRAAIAKATQHHAVATVPPVTLELNGQPHRVTLRVSPVDPTESDYFLVLFDAQPSSDVAAPAPAPAEHDDVAEQLEREVERLKGSLRDTVEQYETSTEELKASNEELQAMNEELRSATEELETSREELQSINEELTTVNQELKIKLDELGSSNSDMMNLMDATSIPTVFLDRQLHITRFTPAATSVFNLIASDVGRPLDDLRNRLDYPMLTEDAARVLDRLTPIEREVQGGSSWYMARILPYRTVDDRIAGVVLTLVDIGERRKATEAARSSEERLRLIVDNARDYAIFSIDRERRITSWNSGAERLLGYAERDIVGDSADKVFTPEDREAGVPQREVDTALAAGRAADDRFHLRKDGTRFWASGTLMPMRNASGELVGFVKILRDMTEARAAQEALEKSRAELIEAWQGTDQARREAELQKENLAALFSQAPMPICILRGPAHEVEFANPQMCQLWGRVPARVLGKPLFEAVAAARATLDAEPLRRVLAEGTARMVREVRARLPRGSQGPLEGVFLNVIYAPLRNVGGRVEGVLVMASDVTDEVRAREQMSELHEAEQAASRAKDDFLAMLGHELRNPLAPLKHSLHLIRRRIADAEDPLLDIAERQAGNLARIVDDLLEAARVTEGKIDLRLEDCDIGDVVKRALDAARTMTEQHDHTVTANLPPRPLVVRADPVRIEQVVFDLLSNAAKYTPAGGRIEVTVRKLGKTAEIRVADNGIGIPPELRPRLFQLFQQGDRPLSRDEGGLGIGLSVVRHLVALHGGRVEAKSEGRGEGSTFIVRLPLPAARAEKRKALLPAPAPPKSEPTVNAVADARPLRVLVVDDNHDAGATLLMVVEALGHAVRLARDGVSAIEQAAEWKPELVFLDIGLPGMDGYEVARELHRRLGDATPRLVAVTGYGQDRDREKTHDAGFAEHLVKPATFESIKSSLEHVVRR